MTPRKPDWQRDGVELHLCDCLELLPTLEVGSVDAIVTDPPYGIVNKFGENNGNGKRTMQFSWDNAGAIGQAIGQAIGLCGESAAAFVFTGFDTVEFARESLRQNGFTVKPAAWVKECPPPAGFGNWWPSGFELAMYGYRNSPWFGDDDPKRCNVFTFDSYRYGQPGKVDHPTQKPLKLMVKIVSAIVPPEGVAIDPFMGSGTTGVGCVRLGRKFIGCEIDPRYFSIAVRRIEAEMDRYPLWETPPPKMKMAEMFASEC